MDNWYDIPDPNFYYNMTKVEGIILNIIPTSTIVNEAIAQATLEVYPNPVSEVLYIKNLPCETVEYTICNALGQEVATGTTSGTLSVAALEKGLYVLQLKGDEFRRTTRIIVE